MRSLAKRADVQASALAAVLGLVWLLAGPRTPDLAAQSYRVGLFERAGFAIWDNGWYAGHHLPAYSLLFPPLGAELGMRVVGAAAAVLAAFCFARLVVNRFGPGARVGVLWFALATASDLAIGRLTYALGAALGLAALLALQRGRELPAGALAALAAAATPLAGLFLGLAGTALFVGGRRRPAAVVAVPALGVAVGLVLAFPEGGRQPFGTRALLVSVILTLAFIALAPDRLLRIGGALYLVGTLAAFVLVTPIGGNTTRLGAVLAGPLLLSARPRRGVARSRAGPAAAVVPVVLVGLFAWQWYAPVREVTHSLDDRLSRAATYQGLFTFLAGHDAVAGRVEVPFTRSHWEASFVAARYPLARGWEKQLDAGYNGLFFGPSLSAATYHEWLRTLGVRYVAVAMAPSDPSSRAEIGLVLGGVPFLRPVYRDPDWRVFAVVDPQPLATPPARMTALGLQSFTLRFARAGTSLVRVRFSPYWEVSRGCVARDPGGYTEVSAPSRGVVRAKIVFWLGRLADPDRRCAAGPRTGGPGFSAALAG